MDRLQQQRKLDADEELSDYDLTRSKPYRGEDRDGNGVINFPPETFDDINHNGSLGRHQRRTPRPESPPTDTSGIPLSSTSTGTASGIWSSLSTSSITTTTASANARASAMPRGPCMKPPITAAPPTILSRARSPWAFPGKSPREAGKATTKITYVQSMANQVRGPGHGGIQRHPFLRGRDPAHRKG